ncbi:hypothetical protein ADN00_13435 [Ornatilinea apprima]|uniref:Uncharacterized protein n=1 Tax=Ornatilinea apprima TaxID=1134406 RepID=A0A0P6XIM8_9CHLR|nr:hypothetical protein [Ornatilinea apprima]KPL74835.1 hypothetical protein ADN00_13435 [Ornatilinea apprima]
METITELRPVVFAGLPLFNMMPILQTNTRKILRIGISGHRFLSDPERLTAALENVCQTLHFRFPQIGWQICSPLAEGADRLAASVFLKHQSDLIAILPLPPEEYLLSFSTADSREEFTQYLYKAQEVIQLPAQPDVDQAYAALGLFLLENCDILLVIWDGSASQGKGGTGEIALEARRRKIPMIWIHAGNRISGTQTATSLGDEQGRVDYENF